LPPLARLGTSEASGWVMFPALSQLHRKSVTATAENLEIDLKILLICLGVV